MYYKFLNENAIKQAPYPLRIEGKDVFTNSEEVYNENGYFKLVKTQYPNDKKVYVPIYRQENNAIVQEWKESDVVLEKKQFKEDLAEINNAENWEDKT